MQELFCSRCGKMHQRFQKGTLQMLGAMQVLLEMMEQQPLCLCQQAWQFTKQNTRTRQATENKLHDLPRHDLQAV